MTFNCQRSKHQGGLKRTCQADSLGFFWIHKLVKMFAGVKGNKKYPARQYKVCAAHKQQSEARNIL
jgi:hypothetical protein